MSKKKKAPHHEEEAGEAWLLPYSDLMTLLLAVFIVLFAVSKLDQKKAEQISGDFTETMMTEGYAAAAAAAAEGGAGGGTLGGEGAHEEESSSKPPTSALEDFFGQYELSKLEDLKTEVDSKLQDEGISDSVSSSIDMRGLVIRLNNAVFFDSGSAVINNEHEDSLIEVAKIINSLDNYIRIEGHTDNVPISSNVYPSNWELSTARASSVVKLFASKGNISPDKIVAVGYGEFKPVEDNSTTEGRAKNRRIDIIVLSQKYNNLEEQLIK